MTETRRRSLEAIILLFASAGTATPYTFTEFPIPMVADIMVAGPDGAVWFASHDPYQNTIGRIAIDGAVTEFPIPTPVGTRAAVFHNVAVGPDGALWFGVDRNILPPMRPSVLDPRTMSVGRITTAGAISEFPLPSAYKFLSGITAGPDGALWFTGVDDKTLGRITTTGELSEFPLPRKRRYPFAIAAGSDGAVWFTEKLLNNTGKIGRITRTDEDSIERIQLIEQIQTNWESCVLYLETAAVSVEVRRICIRLGFC